MNAISVYSGKKFAASENTASVLSPMTGASLDALVEAAATQKQNYLASALSLAFSIALALVICFYKLDNVGIGSKDELIHASAAQSLWQQDHLWTPTVGGLPYFNKPPLKMLATYLPLSIWGDSNFAYRFWDAACGVLLSALVFIVARKLFYSNLAGILACLAMFSASSLILHHGFRFCSQDSAMIFLSSLALIFSFYGFRAKEEQPALWYCLAAGLLNGCATLVKSFGGLIGIVIFGVYYLFLRRAWNIRAFLKGFSKSDFIRWVLVCAPSVLMLGTHLLYLAIAKRHALKSIVGYELVGRISEGYHNVDIPFFYTKQLFFESKYLPPELLFCAIAFGFYKLLKDRESSWPLFLLCWTLIPFLFFGSLPSRQFWYLNPGLIGLSILSAGFLVWLTHASIGKFRQHGFFKAGLRPICFLVLLLIMCARLLIFVGNNAYAVYSTPDPDPYYFAALRIAHQRIADPGFKVLIESSVHFEQSKKFNVAIAQAPSKPGLVFTRAKKLRKEFNNTSRLAVFASEDLARELRLERQPKLMLKVNQTVMADFWVLIYD